MTKHARSNTPEYSQRERKGAGIHILAGIEVDILKTDVWTLTKKCSRNSTSWSLSVHSYMKLERAEMTDRMLAAIENPQTQIIGHPTGRLLLRRDRSYMTWSEFSTPPQAPRRHGVQRRSRPARPEGHLPAHGQRTRRPIVISTDAHSTRTSNSCATASRWRAAAGSRKKTCSNTLPLAQLPRHVRLSGRALPLRLGTKRCSGRRR